MPPAHKSFKIGLKFARRANRKGRKRLHFLPGFMMKVWSTLLWSKTTNMSLSVILLSHKITLTFSGKDLITKSSSLIGLNTYPEALTSNKINFVPLGSGTTDLIPALCLYKKFFMKYYRTNKMVLVTNNLFWIIHPTT